METPHKHLPLPIDSSFRRRPKKKTLFLIEKFGMEENGKPAQKRKANTKLPKLGSSDAPIPPYNPGSCFEGNLNNNNNNNVSNT